MQYLCDFEHTARTKSLIIMNNIKINPEPTMDMGSINDVQDNMHANEGCARVSFIMIRVSYRGGNRKFIIIYHLKRTDPSTLAGNQSRHLPE